MMIEPLHEEDTARAKELYLTAFPEYERCGYESLVRHSQREDTEWLGIYGDGFLGMAYVLFDDDILFLLYFAVIDGYRCKGIGSEALGGLRSRYPGRKMFLNIEPPDEGVEDLEIRQRRMAFYIRNGFIPGNRVADKDGVWMSMVYQDTLSPEETLGFCNGVGLSELFGGGLWIQ